MNRSKDQDRLADQIGRNADRKIQGRRRRTPGLWLGLSTMGMIGWTIVVPTLVGAALGSWIDRNHPGARSWTLALLMAGLTIGCFTAWYWGSEQLKDKDD